MGAPGWWTRNCPSCNGVKGRTNTYKTVTFSPDGKTLAALSDDCTGAAVGHGDPGNITPLNARPHPVQNPVDHLPVVPPPATTPVADRQERPQPFPLLIREITPPHARTNARDRR
ncbi:hypothetical protein Sliba_77990 [Streptomyces nigrescens]|uniref:Uncharacterized protein n=1 Tax=Streptomyces nigrescens TaxID=1920 RepID=A0A640TZI5_STRNI|nr:hypothetical protein Sliba_77990 [Streptomyces libani subsp. libani]GGV96398.1 hypothetical protein GCM10010500_39080 [Streptomyces libani subsp. libani]